MSLPPLDIIEISYGHIRLIRHEISSGNFKRFSLGLFEFIKALSELGEDDYWQKFLRRLKNLHFELCAAPYLPVQRQKLISSALHTLEEHLQICTKLYPSEEKSARLLLEYLEQLLYEPEEPLVAKLQEISRGVGNVAWLIKESRLVAPVEQLLQTLKFSNIIAVHPIQLKELRYYDQIIAVGPARWFPEHIFTAPRAREIHFVIFDWIYDNWQPQNVFVAPYKASNYDQIEQTLLYTTESRIHSKPIPADTTFDFESRIFSVRTTLSNLPSNDDELVEARALLVDGGQVVLVDADEDSSILVIDIDEISDNRIMGQQIEVGMFILVRDGSGGDYIIPFADRILGIHKFTLRNQQSHWKDLLRFRIKRTSLTQTIQELRTLGSPKANEINLKNWVSPRSIKTRDFDDFLAIMKLIGLEDSAEKFWLAMQEIDSAHRRAGFEVRNLLLEQVKDVDVTKLQSQGRIEFKLSQDDDSKLIALRVESILEGTFTVPYSHLGRMIRLDQDAWLD